MSTIKVKSSKQAANAPVAKAAKGAASQVVNRRAKAAANPTTSPTTKPAPQRHAGLSAMAQMVQSNTAIASVFAALGDPMRLKLVAVLCAGGAFSIAQLTANTEISRQGVTKHLQVLAQAGVVRDVKQGRERLWQLEPAQIEEAKRMLDEIGKEWAGALSRLKAFVELG